MVSLPLIKICGFSLWIILLDVGKKVKSLVVSIKQCSPLGDVSTKAKGSPNQLLLNLAREQPLTTRCCYFFHLMKGGFTKGVFIVLLERMSAGKHNPAWGALGANWSGSSGTCSPCSLAHKVQQAHALLSSFTFLSHRRGFFTNFLQTLHGGELDSIVTAPKEQSAKLLGCRTQALRGWLMNTDTLNVHLHKTCSKLVCSTLLWAQ